MNRYHGENSQFVEAPPSNDAIVWRFMDASKYMSLLTSRSIPLIRADKFNDPFEGTIPKLSQNDVRQRMMELEPSARHARGAWEHVAFLNQLLENREWAIQRAHISSWYCQKFDTYNMWKSYGGGENAIAIQTTYGCLVEQLDPDLDIGKIRYIDFDIERLEDMPRFAPFGYKRQFFRDECEVRVMKFDSRAPTTYGVTSEAQPHVIPWSVDLTAVIKSVVISPFAGDWFRAAVAEITENYGLGSNIVSFSKMRG